MIDIADYENYDALGLADLVAAGEVTAAELVETAIARAEALNPQLNAIIVKHYERARNLAALGSLPAPFNGVPFLTKDLAMVDGDVASFGSVFFRDFRSEITDEYQRRVAASGLISIGRSNSPEFGLLPTTEPTLHGPTKNPWDRARSSGGSSGGSAAAVAAGIVPMAHASDGGGSIRIPASSCGVFGMKPSRGLMPRYPGSAADYLSLDLAVSRTVRDSAALLDATCGPVPGSAYQAPVSERPYLEAVAEEPAPLRVAVASVDFRGNRTAPECVAAVAATAGVLEELGHTVVEAKPDVDGQALAEAFLAVWESLAEAVFTIILDEVGKRRSGSLLRSVLGDWRAMKLIAWLDKRKSGRPAFEPFTWDLAERSRRRTPAQLDAAKSELQRVSHKIGAFLEEYDVLLTPVLGRPPLLLGEIDQEAPWDDIAEQLSDYVAFTPVANFSGLPAMSVPTFWSEDGLPIGAHFMGRFGDEFRMLSLAAQLERVVPWFDRRPAM
ncbi:MAG: amidase family protein [Acidimicrobiia bacterium]|nr:amidase family protein [Acidimicrobiia bacterium]